MSKLIQKTIGASVALLVSVAALTAVAGPGDGAAVVIDQPDSPDLIIQELRADNSDATHVPVKVRITVPAHLKDGAEAGTPLRSARLTAYLTATTDPESERLSEAALRVGSDWANRSIVIHVPSPGEGSYFVHVEGELWIDDLPQKFISTSTERVTFGKIKDCKNVQIVPIFGDDEQSCPVLFETKSTELKSAKNQKILDAAVERIDELCTSGNLHRVSVHGWASTLNSFDPPNEVLARDRAAAAVSALRNQVSGCAAQIHDDSEPGTRAVTEKFGKTQEERHLNQCAQIQITSHTCVE